MRNVELRGRYRGNHFSVLMDYEEASSRWLMRLRINGIQCPGPAEARMIPLREAESWCLSVVTREIDRRLSIALSETMVVARG